MNFIDLTKSHDDKWINPFGIHENGLLQLERNCDFAFCFSGAPYSTYRDSPYVLLISHKEWIQVLNWSELMATEISRSKPWNIYAKDRIWTWSPIHDYYQIY